MFDPYSDTNGTDTDTGLLVTPEADLYNWTNAADDADLQVSVHAIGDKYNINLFC